MHPFDGGLGAPPGHPPVPQDELMALVRALHEAVATSDGDALTPEMIDAVAEVSGSPRAHAWVAAGIDPTLVVETKEETLIGVCVGQCQLQGAVPLLEKFLEGRDARIAGGQPSFDVVPRRCFDMCPRAPVVLCQTRDGMAGLPRLTPEKVSEVIDEIFESGE